MAAALGALSGLSTDAVLALHQPAAPVAVRGKMDGSGKARAAAQDFEAVFLQSMFSQMFTDMDGEGPFGGNQGVGVWRSFLTQEYAKSFAQKGGIGLADDVYRSLMAQQEIKAR